MGIVYRATDRLTGQTVALKRVTVPGEQLVFMSRFRDSRSGNILLSLAHEFRILASLRHPHIISVLDYGFDADKQPYITMELLVDSQPLLVAGADCHLETQVDLLIQVLLALAYLHRRGVIHRDLKPDNVQITNGQVKVLDFGLATSHRHARASRSSPSGTLTHMAPEVLGGHPAGIGADLYAVGVMAYELFTGRHPFNLYELDLNAFLDEVRTKPPDVSDMTIPAPLAAVIGRLLAKTPEQRYASARDAIAALCEATGLVLPSETEDIRESYLQTAEFVGRDAELEQLHEALIQATKGNGSAWLLAGESGVGKSRLVSEVRIFALVNGAQVFHGQVENVGDSPYGPWRNILRLLALASAPDDFEAAVLQLIIPDIASLLGRTNIPELPALDPAGSQLRLFSVISTLVQRLDTPLVFILEDLQWASPETVNLLNWVSRRAVDHALFVIGNYRDDETPRMADYLPDMQMLKLQRLEMADIARLSQAMLGESGKAPQVIDLIQRETEGNAFFMVEVVRALAEEAGRLDKIIGMTLPDKVFAGGMQTIIQRRLQQVSDRSRPLLVLAAVAGRYLDLTVMRTLAPRQKLDLWLADCADCAVLEIENDRWFFAHDKLREAVVDQLAAEELRSLHERVAIAIEGTYSDRSDYAGRLAYHWARADNVAKEIKYSILAGRESATRFANDDAVRFFRRALELTTEDKLPILYELAQIYELISQWDSAEDLVRRAIVMPTITPDHQRVRAQCQSMLGRILSKYKGDYQEAIAHLQQARATFDKLEDKPGLVEVYSDIATAYSSQGEREAGLDYLGRQKNLATEIADSRGLSNALRRIGHIHVQEGDNDKALACYEQSLELAQAIDDPKAILAASSSLGVFHTRVGNLDRALDNLLLQHGQAQLIGDISSAGETIISIGALYRTVGDLESAVACCEQGLSTSSQLVDQLGSSIGLIYLAQCYGDQQRYDESEQCSALAIAIVRRMNKVFHLAGYLSIRADIAYDRGNYTEAQEINEQANELARRIGISEYQFRTEILKVKLRHKMRQSNTATAVGQFERLLDHWAEPKEQAEIQHALWKVDRTQINARDAAAETFRDLYQQSPQIIYRENYESLTGETLPERSRLPAVTGIIGLQPTNPETYLRLIKRWLAATDAAL